MSERLRPPYITQVIAGEKDTAPPSEETSYPLGKAIEFFNRNRDLVERASPEELADVQHMIEHRIARDPHILTPLADTGIDVFLLDDSDFTPVA